jgi:MFS family permease
MWRPLKEPVFRALWIAAFVSNIGSLMQEVGSAWLMTSLTREPLMVALLATATNVPYFLLTVLAGTFADVIDRRSLLIVGQIWMAVAALILGVLTVMGMTNVWSLLALTLFLGFGAAITGPAWNAMIPELVPREQLEEAIALGSVGYNTARGLGSALGGLLVAASGPGCVFLFNGFSFIGVIAVLFNYKPKADLGASVDRSGERIITAMKAGLRFARHSASLRAVFIKTFIWANSVSAMWALLPLIARERLQLDSVQYGLLLGAFGAGTLTGAAMMPRLRQTFSLEISARIGFCVWALFQALLGFPINFSLAALYMVALGAAWVVVNSCLNAGTQLSVPSWVRGRALGIYILIFQGSIATGSALWGWMGNHTGITMPLFGGSMLLMLGLLAGSRYTLGTVEQMDTTLSNHWKDPTVINEPGPNDGPVMITVEYIIDPAKGAGFIEALKKLGVQRKRDGAFQWHVYSDLSKPSRYVENFVVENWGEHVRQHERVMNADRAAELSVDGFHIGMKPPIVRHWISAFAIHTADTPEGEPLREIM